ncbi:MAG: hypothetical protein ACRDQX_00925 [Pseudonocardiaceae bacterium]
MLQFGYSKGLPEFTLYDDPHVVIKGNTNGSAGYLYVGAYPTVSR